MSRKKAILLIGPTGAGKTPLGEALTRSDPSGMTFAHLDFGECLRRVVAGEDNYGLGETDRNFLVEVLKTGALLENETFYLAARIIEFFLARRAADSTHVVLNGIPRHLEQACDVALFFAIEAVIHLSCATDVIAERIRQNTGGDRAGRTDDMDGLVMRKIEIFNQRTLPLVDYYQTKGAAVLEVPIGSDTTTSSVASQVTSWLVRNRR